MSDMPESKVSALSALALNPKAGEPFTLGGRDFTRQFLLPDAEEALIALIVGLTKDAASQSLTDLFLTSTKELRRAAAIIVSDQAPECDEAWLRATRGITTNQLVDLVLAQLSLNEVIPLLGKLLSVAGLLGAVSARPESTSPTPPPRPDSSSGDAPATVEAPAS